MNCMLSLRLMEEAEQLRPWVAAQLAPSAVRLSLPPPNLPLSVFFSCDRLQISNFQSFSNFSFPKKL